MTRLSSKDAEELSATQREDVADMLESIIYQPAPIDLRGMGERALRRLDRIDRSEFSETVQVAFEQLARLANEAKVSPVGGIERPSYEDRVRHAALEYFVDQWDVIPDSIPGSGLLDDAYAVQLALEMLEEGDGTSTKEDGGSLTPGGLSHIADRTAGTGLLGRFAITSLRKMARDWNERGLLTPHEKRYLEAQFEKLRTQERFLRSCPRGRCPACEAVGSMSF